MRIRVLTYNVHKAIGVDRVFAPERILAILEHYDADVALLQEVDKGVPRSGMLDLAMHLARRLDYHHRAIGMNVYLRRGLYGNATLSRFPIGRQHNINLTIRGSKRRGAQHTTIHVKKRNRQVDVTSTYASGANTMSRSPISRTDPP